MKCENCGREFECEHEGQRFCSHRCQSTFATRKWRKAHPAKAQECARRAAQAYRDKHGLGRAGTVGECPECGGRFVRQHGKQRFCSPACRREYFNEKLREQRSAEGRKRRKALEAKVCVVCGKSFVPYRADAMCCSPACRKAHTAQLSRRARMERAEIDRAREAAGLPPLQSVKRYAQIKQANIERPLEAGWRGRSGGGSGSNHVPVALQVDDAWI